MTLCKRLACFVALYLAACAPVFAADPSARPAPFVRHGGGGLAWGLAPGVGQLGAAGLGYYHTDNCRSHQPAYDEFGDYVGERPANICIELPHNY